MNPLRILYGTYALTVFGVVVFAITCPLIIVGPTLSLRRHIGRVGVRVAMWLMGSPLRIDGEHLLPTGPCVVVANHASYLDGIVLTAALPPRVSFVVQDGAATWPFVGLVIRRMGVTFVTRTDPKQGSRQMRELIRRVGNGESFAVFPEGRFEAEPGLMAFRDGAFLMASRNGVPVVPTVIAGTRALYGDRMRLPAPSPVRIRFFTPIQEDAAGRHGARALRAVARTVMVEQLDEPDRAPEQRSAS